MINLLKRLIKNVFIKLNALPVLDHLNYNYSILKFLAKNRTFRKKHPDFAFPPNYYLYETYRLDYEQYKEDGELTAREVLDWCAKYIQGQLKILEWGCGVGRVIRHVPHFADKASLIVGVDINDEMIQWNSDNISDVTFKKIEYSPPTFFHNNQFNLVFALSVFTHIESNLQLSWLAEIHRILEGGGIFLFTTHGSKYDANLSNTEKEMLYKHGSLTIDYKQKGHRMMSTYNSYESFRLTVTKYFEILEFYKGENHPEKVGGQDLWIVKKRNTQPLSG